MTALRDTAKAKINLTLEVLGRRPDFYHELKSLVAFAELGDAVAAVRRLVSAGASRREAADVVSALAHVSRNALYRASLDRPD